MSQPVTIRPARQTDYPAIDRLGRFVQADHAQAHPEMFRAGVTALAEDRFGDLLANPRARLLVADDGRQIEGFVVLERREAPAYPVFEARNVAMIEVLVVEPGAQGRGVGRRLMAAAAVELSVFEFNTNAIGFYEHLGFSTMRRTMTMPVDPAVDQAVSERE